MEITVKIEDPLMGEIEARRDDEGGWMITGWGKSPVTNEKMDGIMNYIEKEIKDG